MFLSGKPKDFPLEESDYKSNRNYRRSAEVSTSIPLITVETLEYLVSNLFFQRKKNRHEEISKKMLKFAKDNNLSTSEKKRSEIASHLDKFRYLRIRLRVLMSIGPRSGL
jgi:hypothetical protein